TRITMAFLGMLQAGLVLSLERPLTALLRRPGLWFLTVLVNQRIMTWFLWHLTVMVGLAHLLLALDARAVLPEPLTGLWWATRPVWALVLLALTGLVVLVMGRFEDPRADDRPAPAAWKSVLAAVTVIAGLAVMASVGVVGESGVTWWWPLLPVVGMWMFGVIRTPARGSSRGSRPLHRCARISACGPRPTMLHFAKRRCTGSQPGRMTDSTRSRTKILATFDSVARKCHSKTAS